MFLRIANLALALYYGQIAKKERRRDPSALTPDQEGEGAKGGVEGAEGNGDYEGGGHDSSWSGWAWSVGSSVGTALLPVYWEEDDEAGSDLPKVDVKRDLVLHAGIYVESATLVLKLTELLLDGGGRGGLFGSTATKQCFAPFLKLDCAGIFQEIMVKGMGAVNVSAGISELRLSPLGRCPCGVEDIFRQQGGGGGDQETPYLTSGSISGRKSYLRGSLFELSPSGNGEDGVESDLPIERKQSYKVEWDEHLEAASEEKMLLRTPAFAMDYLYFLEIPPDYSSEQLSEAGFDLEYSDLSERALCRFVFGPALVKVSSGLIHRLSMTAHAASFYDYIPYRLVGKIAY